MTLFKEVVLKDSIEIDATPEKMWDFYTNLEMNYKMWQLFKHPK